LLPSTAYERRSGCSLPWPKPIPGKKYLRDNGIARSRKESTSKAAHTLRQKAANNALSAYDMQELRECRVLTLALSLMHKPKQLV
jgi:hypothetical protein